MRGTRFDDPDLVAAQFEGEEADAKQEWHDRLRSNVLELLAEVPSFTVFHEFERVFAGTIGLARTTHLRAVLMELHQQD